MKDDAVKQSNHLLTRQLWMFLAVAEEGHFGRAAEKLGMTQPPLSEHIKTLEASLGVTLFERSRRGTKLSSAGAALLPAVIRFADHAAKLELTVREVAEGQLGVLNVGAITSAMTEIIPLWLAELRQTNPNVSIAIQEIDSVEAAPGLLDGTLDIAFYRLDGHPGKGLDGFPVTYDRLWVALPENHELSAMPKLPLVALAGHPLVMPSRAVSPAYFDSIVGACRTHDLTPRILHEVRSIVSQLAFVSCGQGAALVPQSMRRLAPENVRIVPLLEEISIVTTAIAWPTERHSPLAEQAIQVMRRIAAGRSDAAH
ncbi:MAG: LysR family transcriptional regulator [Litoreibacter sp.]|nr:LysR family transcriptional regulator [Litoreibacter sp.]